MAYPSLPRGTETAVIVGIALLIIWLIWGSLRFPEALWAPGDLSRYHADVAGCNQCHQPFQGATANKCTACHTDNNFSFLPKPSVSKAHKTIILENKPCTQCHTEHRGALAQITIGALQNPHGEFIFRATATRSCSACHDLADASGSTPKLLDNLPVKYLLAKGEGKHQPGKMKHCLRCHSGGRMNVN